MSDVDDDQFAAAERAGYNPYDHVPRRSVPVWITDEMIHAWLDGEPTEGGDTRG